MRKITLTVPGENADTIDFIDRKGNKRRKRVLDLTENADNDMFGYSKHVGNGSSGVGNGSLQQNGSLQARVNGSGQNSSSGTPNLSSKNKRIEIRPHALFPVEIIQMCNLCPESVTEVRTLIPTLKRIPEAVLWYYVKSLEPFSKAEIADSFKNDSNHYLNNIHREALGKRQSGIVMKEYDDESLEKRALLNARVAAINPAQQVDPSARILKKRKVGIDKFMSDAEFAGMPNPRIILGQDREVRKQYEKDLGEKEIANRRKAYYKLLHDRIEKGIRPQDVFNPAADGTGTAGLLLDANPLDAGRTGGGGFQYFNPFFVFLILFYL